MILLDTIGAVIAPGDLTFAFTVPGDRYWQIRTVIAVATRDVGGAPDRAYLLTVATSTGPVSIVGAADAGDEPGTCTVTWANVPASAVASGAVGVVVAPFAPPVLYPGYTVTGEITSPAAADEWQSATVWYEYVLTSAG